MKLICWLVRAAGGSHKWRRMRKGERPDLGRLYRICDRCGEIREVKTRTKKGVA